MATLRKWRPVEPQRKKSFLTVERGIILAGCGAFGLAIAMMTPGADPATTAAIAHNNAQSLARTAAEAKRAEAALRERERARLRQEHAREQAVLFQERYNTDRTPTGSVETDGPATAPASPAPAFGFQEIKPPPMSAGGMREISGFGNNGR